MWRHQPSQKWAKNEAPFPKGFTNIRELLHGNLKDRATVSVLGVVKDYRLPIPTRGADYKCAITLYDKSTEEDQGIELNIFRQEAEMPVVEAGDVVMVTLARFQDRGGSYSLLTSYQTEVHVYDARQIPGCKKFGSAHRALRQPNKKVKREPDARADEYVLWMFERIDKTVLPTQEQFQERQLQSRNVKDKFSLLHDIRDGKFADLVVQVVKTPFDLGDKMNIWVSDYTENSSFFHRTNDNADWTDGVPTRDGDPYGYTIGRKKQAVPSDDGALNWNGPLGKMSFQLTCWEPHAQFIRDHVQMGEWIRLRNVQIRIGNNSRNLEGALREDREYGERVYVEILDPHADRETLDTRLVDALKRKRDYEKDHKASRKIGEKRKAEEVPKKENHKSRRRKVRENKQKAIEAELAMKEAALGLNEIIVAEHVDKAIVPLSTTLDPVFYNTTIDGQEVKLELPFTCAQYRTNVRIVDFHPVSLEDFAIGRTHSEYDMLSDNEDSDSSPTSSQLSDEPRNLRHAGRDTVWEWRFSLKLEEVTVPPKTKTPAQIWAVVDNCDAQLLLSLDATDLHDPQNAEDVGILRERLFKLWGNLEECKSRLETKRQQHARDPLKVPPPDSSLVKGNNDSDARRSAGEVAHDDDPAGSQLSNRPFTCCIRQYGVKVRVERDEMATAGEGKRWQRVFGLFGTKIRDE